jgi:inhibitor of cysteine peptidase
MGSTFTLDRRILRHWLLLIAVVCTDPVPCETVYGDPEVRTMSSPVAVVTATDRDNGQEIAVPVGGLLVLRLEAVPGTGYGWQVTKEAGPHLTAVGQPFFEPSGKVEAGGTEVEVFHFRVVAKGRAQLELVYRRPWEKHLPPAKSFEISVRVE